MLRRLVDGTGLKLKIAFFGMIASALIGFGASTASAQSSRHHYGYGQGGYSYGYGGHNLPSSGHGYSGYYGAGHYSPLPGNHGFGNLNYVPSAGYGHSYGHGTVHH